MTQTVEQTERPKHKPDTQRYRKIHRVQSQMEALPSLDRAFIISILLEDAETREHLNRLESR